MGNVNHKPFYPNQSKPLFQQQTEQLNQFPNENSDNVQSPDIQLMESLQYVKENYNVLVGLNDMHRGLTQIVMNQAQPRFFVIKSFTEEDIHKVKNYSYQTIYLHFYSSQSNMGAGHQPKKETKS